VGKDTGTDSNGKEESTTYSDVTARKEKNKVDYKK
jgi:hypothetical protein